MKVARIEKSIQGQTYGPFTAVGYDSENEAVYYRYIDNLSRLPPTPSEDGIAFTWGMVCGFVSGYMAHRWLTHPEILNNLRSVGMVFSLYEVPDDKLKYGKAQVCFWPTDATKIRELTTNELLAFADSAFELKEA